MPPIRPPRRSARLDTHILDGALLHPNAESTAPHKFIPDNFVKHYLPLCEHAPTDRDMSETGDVQTLPVRVFQDTRRVPAKSSTEASAVQPIPEAQGD